MTGPVRSVSQAFAILRVLASHPQGLTLSAIARAAALSPSSCLGLLRTLVAEGVVRRSQERLYRPAPGLRLPAGGQTDLAGFIAAALPAMQGFARAHEATIGLWHAVSSERLELVALAESGASTRIHMAVGQRQPIGGGATGRALAASEGVAPDELLRRHRAVCWQAAVSPSEYARQVEQAGARGFAIDDGLGHAGICSLGCRVAAPGPIRLCLSASVFANSRSDEEIERLGEALAALGQTLARTA